MLEAGRVLNQYEIVRLLGKGGMGEVYLARDQRLGREVALKVLPEDLAANDERRERFEREARSVAALQHPNIVTLHSIEEAEGMTFLVMELIGGKPLSEVIPRGGLPLERLLEIAIPLADAVAAAHARGITHRDLKPENVLIDTDGRPQILDFGLAKVNEPAGLDGATMEPTEALTGEGRIVGTVAYMSPEQVEGLPVDARSDIFSLGIILYEMAVGARPFDGDTSMSVLTAILRDEPQPVTERNERLPRYLGRVVKRCLQKEPSRRFQSALDLRNDLVELKEELASGELTGPEGASPSPAGRRRAWLPLLGALMIVALGSLWWSTRRAADRAPEGGEPPYKIRRLSVRGSPETAAISPDGRHVAYVSAEIGGRSLRLQQVASGSDIELLPRVDWNVRLWDLSFTPDGDFVRYSQGAGGEARTIWEVPALGGPRRKLAEGALVGVSYSPDGSRVTLVPGTDFTERWSRLEVASLDDGGRQTVYEVPGASADIGAVAWSPDGGTVAIEVFDDREGSHIMLVSPESGEAVRLADVPVPSAGDMCWSPDGSEIAVVGRVRTQSQVQIWGLSLDGTRRNLLAPDPNDYSGCSMTADGRFMVTVREETHSRIWIVPVAEPAAASAVSTTTGRADGSDRVTWLDDETIVYGSPSGDMWNVWRVADEGGTSAQLTSDGAFSPSASQAGRISFNAGWGLEHRQGVFGLDLESGERRRLSPEGHFADRGSLTPDGERVFYELLGGERIRFVRSRWEGGEPEIVTEQQAHLASFSPDGRRVALHVRNAELDRWQTAIFPVDSVPGEHSLDLHSETHSPWASDDSLYISRSEDGVANIYRVNVDDLAEEQVTLFTEDQIFAFDVSPDRTKLAVGRGAVVNDLLLVEGLVAGAGR